MELNSLRKLKRENSLLDLTNTLQQTKKKISSTTLESIQEIQKEKNWKNVFIFLFINEN